MDINNTNEKIDGFFRLPAVLDMIPVSRSAWYAGIKAGNFPKGIKIGKNTAAWKKSDIQELCDRLEKGDF